MKKKRLSEKLTEKVLRELCESGETDAAIGKAYGMTGEGVAYRRKKYGISSGTSHRLSSLEKISTKALRRDYYALNQYDFSKKYSVSKTVWRRVLKDRGISSKANKNGWDKDSTERAVALLKSGRNLTQIAAELGVCRTSVGRLFKRTGVSYRPRNRLAPSWLGEYKLSTTQVSVLVGDMFGDGGLVRSGPSAAYYQCGHCLSQESFLDWKYEIFSPLSCRRSEIETQDKRSGGYRKAVHMATWSTKEFFHWWSIFYPSGEGSKVPTGRLVEYLDWRGIAVWFMGDGKKTRNNYYFSVGLQVDVPDIVAALDHKFGKIFTCKRYKKEWLIKVEQPAFFREKIGPYILSDFQYKIGKKPTI